MKQNLHFIVIAVQHIIDLFKKQIVTYSLVKARKWWQYKVKIRTQNKGVGMRTEMKR